MTVKKSPSDTRDHPFTEDDTFRVLCRPSLQEMGSYYLAWARKNRNSYTPTDRGNFFLSHGWTLREFVDKHREQGIRLPHD